MPNWPKILTVDVYGRINHLPCWNNPDYRTWWLSTVEDLFKSYPLDGFKYGAERSGPLPNLLVNGDVPGCFCDLCRARGRETRVSTWSAPARASRTLYEFISRPPGRQGRAARWRTGDPAAHPAQVPRDPGLGIPVA